MWFCPLDGTLLQIQILSSASSSAAAGGGRGGDGKPQSIFTCTTCPCSCAIGSAYTKRLHLSNKKAVDDILGGAAAWENVDRTMAVCPACSHMEAYFMQMQIRSADEPMSVFYKCVKCSHQWNDK
jgi:DNA-directed RNA polymerase III subunit RPC11